MGKKSDEKTVWPWEYNNGNAYEWPFEDKVKNNMKKGGKNE